MTNLGEVSDNVKQWTALSVGGVPDAQPGGGAGSPRMSPGSAAEFRQAQRGPSESQPRADRMPALGSLGPAGLGTLRGIWETFADIGRAVGRHLPRREVPSSPTHG